MAQISSKHSNKHSSKTKHILCLSAPSVTQGDEATIQISASVALSCSFIAGAFTDKQVAGCFYLENHFKIVFNVKEKQNCKLNYLVPCQPAVWFPFYFHYILFTWLSVFFFFKVSKYIKWHYVSHQLALGNMVGQNIKKVHLVKTHQNEEITHRSPAQFHQIDHMNTVTVRQWANRFTHSFVYSACIHGSLTPSLNIHFKKQN